MTRKEAIKIIELECDDWETSHCSPMVRREAFDMAIKALGQPECEDVVGRQAVLDELDTCFDTLSFSDDVNGGNYISYEDAVGAVEDLPSVTLKLLECEDAVSRDAVLDASEWFGERATHKNPMPNGVEAVPVYMIKRLPSVTPRLPECEDAISRAEAIRIASGYCHPANVAKELGELPSVNPTPDKDALDAAYAHGYTAAESELRKTGFWTNIKTVFNPFGEPEVVQITCSVCGAMIGNMDKPIRVLKMPYKPKFCPNCGAKMEDK